MLWKDAALQHDDAIAAPVLSKCNHRNEMLFDEQNNVAADRLQCSKASGFSLPSIADEDPFLESENTFNVKSLDDSETSFDTMRQSFKLERDDSDIFDLADDKLLSFGTRKSVGHNTLPSRSSSIDVFFEKIEEPGNEDNAFETDHDSTESSRGFPGSLSSSTRFQVAPTMDKRVVFTRGFSAPTVIAERKFETIKKKFNESARQVKVTNEKKARAVTLFLHQALAKRVMVLPYLDKLHLFVNAMEVEDILQGQTIIKQGDDGDYFYVIEMGEVDIVVDGKVVAEASVGEVFGELALLYAGKRTASCIAKTKCKLWKIDSLNFRSLIDEANSENQGIFNFLSTKPLFSGVPPRQVVEITEAARVTLFDDYDRIYCCNDEAAAIFYIMKGSVVIYDTVSKSKNMLSAGELFGHTDILAGSLRTSSATAAGNVEVIVLETKSIESITGKKLSDLLGKKELIKNLVRRQMCVL